MTERNDVLAFPANVARTMPYTAYLATFAYATMFQSAGAAKLLAGLVANELVNHGAKQVVKRAFPNAAWVKRPPGAMDTGVYPAHYPKISTTSGMPSGHAQTSWFMATVLLRYFWQTAPSASSIVISYATVLATACAVTLSRTQYGGILCVHINGEIRPPHTPAQVVVGACIGMALGWAAFTWFGP